MNSHLTYFFTYGNDTWMTFFGRVDIFFKYFYVLWKYLFDLLKAFHQHHSASFLQGLHTTFITFPVLTFG